MSGFIHGIIREKINSKIQIMENFYEVLSINSNATQEEITKAFKEKAKLYHPDKNDGSQAAEAMFKIIGLAKETLLDANKRLEHDYRFGFKKQAIAAPNNEISLEKIIGVGLLTFVAALLIGAAVKSK